MSKHQGAYYNFVSLIGKKLISIIEWQISRNVESKVFFTKEEFQWIKKIERNYPLILNEYFSIKAAEGLSDINEISNEQDIVIERNSWNFFPLRLYGVNINENISKAPKTYETLQCIPNVTTAFFSVLKPHKLIKPHRGAYKGYLRMHLGVNIPDENACGIRFDDYTYHWKNGEAVIFDDTFVHDAWNNADKERVILYVDFIRPMPKYLTSISKLLTLLIQKSPYTKNALTNLQKHSQQANDLHL